MQSQIDGCKRLCVLFMLCLGEINSFLDPVWCCSFWNISSIYSEFLYFGYLQYVFNVYQSLREDMLGLPQIQRELFVGALSSIVMGRRIN